MFPACARSRTWRPWYGYHVVALCLWMSLSSGVAQWKMNVSKGIWNSSMDGFWSLENSQRLLESWRQIPSLNCIAVPSLKIQAVEKKALNKDWYELSSDPPFPLIKAMTPLISNYLSFSFLICPMGASYPGPGWFCCVAVKLEQDDGFESALRKMTHATRDTLLVLLQGSEEL